MLGYRNKIELRLYQLFTGDSYDPEGSDREARHARMQAICHLVKRHNGFPEFNFMMGDQGPSSSELEEDLKRIDGNPDETKKMNMEINQILPHVTSLDIIEHLVLPLFRNASDVEFDGRLEACSRLAFSADAAASVSGGRDAIIARAFEGMSNPPGKKEAESLLNVLCETKVIDHAVFGRRRGRIRE